jgi:hypothetical protein
MNQNNPLKQYFRQPSIYIKLPSKGNFYPKDSIQIPENGELPVFPMTAIDEITYRTPDALFNGQAVVDVIQSCVPAIKNAWAIPAMDVDTVLVAIRIASYGHQMDFTTRCPACNALSDQAVDLRNVLERIKLPDYQKTIIAGNMEIFFRPMTYKNLNENNKMQFEEQKIIQMLPDDDQISEEDARKKISAIGDALRKITTVTVKALAQSVAAIKTPDALVNESDFIEEFLLNCDSLLFNKVRDHILTVKSEGEIQPLLLTCDECKHEYQQTITLDMSNFFERAS